MSYEKPEPIEATVAELKPRMKNVTIAFKVIEIGDTREVDSRRDGKTYHVADVIVGDATGIVKVPLWNDAIETVEAEKTYLLTNGYTSLFRGNLQLNVGRYGELAEAEEEIEEVNMDVDMSLEKHEDTRRRRYSGGRDRYDGGSRGRSYGYNDRERRSY